ncbi:MAG TPA: hypothetical protein VGF83_05840 [Actinomycetota bacterium]
MRDATTLYRFFGEDAVLLYVGITGNLPRRLGEHSSDKPWWLQVQHVTTSHYRSREEAATAELAAIRTEHPRFNVAGRPFDLERITWPKLLIVEPSLQTLEDAALRYDVRQVDWWRAWALGDGSLLPFKRVLISRVGWAANRPCLLDYSQAERELNRPPVREFGHLLDDEVNDRAQVIHRSRCPNWNPVHPLVYTSEAYDAGLKHFTRFLADAYGDSEDGSDWSSRDDDPAGVCF